MTTRQVVIHLDGVKSKVYINGQDVSNMLRGVRITQDAFAPAVVTLEGLPDSMVITGKAEVEGLPCRCGCCKP